MKLACACEMFGGDPLRAVSATADAGLRHVEVHLDALDVDVSVVRTIRDHCDTAGLSVACVRVAGPLMTETLEHTDEGDFTALAGPGSRHLRVATRESVVTPLPGASASSTLCAGWATRRPLTTCGWPLNCLKLTCLGRTMPTRERCVVSPQIPSTRTSASVSIRVASFASITPAASTSPYNASCRG